MKALAATLALLICATFGLAAGAEAKKKHKAKSAVFTQVLPLNTSIPDSPVTGAATPVRSSIVVGNKFKGKRVGDVNVLGLQTTGSASGAATQLLARLSAPNGRTVTLFRGKGDQSLGPWTLDDDTPVSICNAITPPCLPPNQSLNRPFAGTSNLAYNDDPLFTPLQTLDGIPIKGAWTLTIFDTFPGLTSTLNQWGVQITAAKPVTK